MTSTKKKLYTLFVFISVMLQGCSHTADSNRMETTAPTPVDQSGDAQNGNQSPMPFKIPEKIDHTNEVLFGSEADSKSSFPLLASIPEENIYLYGIKDDTSIYDNNMVLYVNDIAKYYEISFYTPRMVLPKMKLADFDGDGTKELALTNYYGSGTGISMEGLHIIDINKKTEGEQPWTAHVFYPDAYVKQLARVVSYKLVGEPNSDTIELVVDGKTYTVTPSYVDFKESGKITDVRCSESIVGFSFEGNQIKVEFGLGVMYENFADFQYIGTVYADCTFNGGDFTLSNFYFKAD